MSIRPVLAGLSVEFTTARIVSRTVMPGILTPDNGIAAGLLPELSLEILIYITRIRHRILGDILVIIHPHQQRRRGHEPQGPFTPDRVRDHGFGAVDNDNTTYVTIGRQVDAACGPNQWRARTGARRLEAFYDALQLRTCLSVTPSSSAACFCVINFFFAFFRATRRSRSACVISSSPCSTSPAWTASTGHFYFAQIGHYHFAPTGNRPHLKIHPAPLYNCGPALITCIFPGLSARQLCSHCRVWLRRWTSPQKSIPSWRRVVLPAIAAQSPLRDFRSPAAN